MANQLTVKQEKFCHLVVELGNASDAYRQAFDSKAKPESVYVSASRLLANDKIGLRVSEIRQELRERNRATLDDILAELEEARQLARDIEQPAAMNQASLGKAKLLGLDKQIVDHISSDKSMSPKELDSRLVDALVSKLET